VKRITPEVYLLSEMKLVTHDPVPNLLDWLSELEGSKVLTHITGKDPEMLVELGARRCYKSFDVGLNPNVTRVRTDSADYHENILQQRHGSVLAHSHCTFAFEYVSRVETHEHIRNSTGNDFSQESMRYVRPTDIAMWVPDWAQEDPFVLKEVIDSAAEDEARQKRLAEHFKIDEMKDFSQKKLLTSFFRRLLPHGIGTGIVTTFNFRSLRWFIEQRSQVSAEEEIRLIVDKLALIATTRWPYVFGDFGKNEQGEWMPKYSKV
jgi:thymidylate synthase (FAD)